MTITEFLAQRLAKHPDYKKWEMCIYKGLAAFGRIVLQLRAYGEVRQQAHKEADSLLDLFENGSLRDFYMLPPVSGMTVLAVIAKADNKTTEAAKAMLKGLDDGRKLGSIKRKAKAEENLHTIKKAIDDLFKNGKGWQMSNPEIADFLINSGIGCDYEYSTMLKKVKAVARSSRVKYKSGQ